MKTYKKLTEIEKKEEKPPGQAWGLNSLIEVDYAGSAQRHLRRLP
jgi:hypothetical protein